MIQRVLVISVFLILSLSVSAQNKQIRGKVDILYHSESLPEPVKIQGNYTLDVSTITDSVEIRQYLYKIYDKSNSLVLEISLRSGEFLSYLYKSNKFISGKSVIKLTDFIQVPDSNGTVRIAQCKSKAIPPINIIYQYSNNTYYLLQFSFLTDQSGKNYDEFIFELITE